MPAIAPAPIPDIDEITSTPASLTAATDDIYVAAECITPLSGPSAGGNNKIMPVADVVVKTAVLACDDGVGFGLGAVEYMLAGTLDVDVPPDVDSDTTDAIELVDSALTHNRKEAHV
jgi:hypothetical protein